MGSSILAALGAALQQGGGDMMDQLARRRAQRIQQEQFDAQQAAAQRQFAEGTRHSKAMEAMQQAGIDLQGQNLALERQNADYARQNQLRDDERANVDQFVKSMPNFQFADPKRAMEAFQMAGKASTARDLRGNLLFPEGNAFEDARQEFFTNVGPTQHQMVARNEGMAYVPGSESFGGGFIENKQFSPYSFMASNSRGANDRLQLFTTAFDQARRDIELQGDRAHDNVKLQMDKISQYDPEAMRILGEKATKAREDARRASAISRSQAMQRAYPEFANQVSVEALLGNAPMGQSTATQPFGDLGGAMPSNAPVNQNGAPPKPQSQQTGVISSDPFGLGVSQIPGQSPRPRAPQTTSSADPLGLFSTPPRR